MLLYLIFFFFSRNTGQNNRSVNDTTVYVQHDSIDGAIQILNSELATLSEWFDSSKLTLNVNKTQMLMMSRKKTLNPQGN